MTAVARRRYCSTICGWGPHAAGATIVMVLNVLPGPASADQTGSPRGLSLSVLGSGGPGATGRAASSYLVSLDSVPRVLVDAGPGSFARLGELHLSLQATDIVLLTHLHADHAAELPGFVKARAVASSGRLAFEIWGPTGAAARGDQPYFPSTSRFVDLLFGSRGAFAYLKDFSAPISWSPHDIVFEAGDTHARSLLNRDGLQIRAAQGHHGDAPAVIYRIDYAGKSITVSGDIDSLGLPALRALAQGTDLLLFDCPVLDPPGSPAVLYQLHSPPKAIGEVAAAAGAGQLLLSHLSPDTERERASVDAAIRASYHGKVTFAVDKLQVKP